jgi:hypothetical protein
MPPSGRGWLTASFDEKPYRFSSSFTRSQTCRTLTVIEPLKESNGTLEVSQPIETSSGSYQTEDRQTAVFAIRQFIADDSQSQALRLRPLKPEHHDAENLDITKNYGHTVCNAG